MQKHSCNLTKTIQNILKGPQLNTAAELENYKHENSDKFLYNQISIMIIYYLKLPTKP